MPVKSPDLNALFNPSAVAIVGASRDEGKLGYKFLQNTISGSYKGKVYPINPAGGSILEIPVLKTIEELPNGVDLASVIIPAKYVFEAVKKLADKGVKFCTIIASGFSEIGNIEEENKIVEYAVSRGMRILGPNIFGIYSAKAGINFTFGPREIRQGSVAIITQSGALGVAMLGKTAVEKIGLSTIISVGNKADLNESDLIEYLIEDPLTKIIFIYIEGVKDGPRLVNVLKNATRKKPIIVIKSGRSQRGAIAASSHTGSLAGSEEVFDAVMRQCGVLRAESIRDGFNWCKLLSTFRQTAGDNTVIITNGGGVGVMATDACEKYGVRLSDDREMLEKTFRKAMPAFGSAKNPIDLTAEADEKVYGGTLDVALQNPEIDAVLALYAETALMKTDILIRMVSENFEKYRIAGKPLLFTLIGGFVTENAIAALRTTEAPVYTDVYETVNALGALNAYSHVLREKPDEPREVKIDHAAISEVVRSSLAADRHQLPSPDAQKMLKAAGFATPRSRVASNLEDAIVAAREIGYPVVMKIVSKDILHKSDAGGVALNLENTDEVIDAYQAIMQRTKQRRESAIIEGVEIAEMVKRGTEIIVGVRRDRAFGPIAMAGLGGIYVEVMKDIAFRALPAGRREILNMLKEIKSYQLLLGVRGEKPRDIEALSDSIERLGAIILNHEEITDVEINPLMVYEKGVMTIDARIILARR